MRGVAGPQSRQNASRTIARRQKGVGRPHDDSRADVVRGHVGRHQPVGAIPRALKQRVEHNHVHRVAFEEPDLTSVR
jgi:hypothetical protein